MYKGHCCTRCCISRPVVVTRLHSVFFVVPPSSIFISLSMAWRVGIGFFLQDLGMSVGGLISFTNSHFSKSEGSPLCCVGTRGECFFYSCWYFPFLRYMCSTMGFYRGLMAVVNLGPRGIKYISRS